jgi:methanogenic corrinoid protein MtbC1
MAREKNLVESIAAAVRDGSEEDAVSLCEQAVGEGISPQDILKEGLSKGMHEVGEQYERHELFLPEMLLSAEAMHAGLSALLPSLKSEDDPQQRETVVIGVVKGDVHEIGKNMVGVMLEVEGYEVVDLGYDVGAQKFLDEVKTTGAKVLALSTMMTTTLPNMRRTVELANALNPKPLVIVGGAPLSEAVTDDMGAAGYEDNAAKVHTLIRKLLD